ncbi:MAG: ABC transporter ATP-binding protein [Selenomonadaceae bacterium]|nr:ABC transporter ATP-binding protein [Selenomonadaceae bacterium]
MEKELIRLENVAKAFGNLRVLDEVDLSIYESEFITLLGPSGCGKTTMLRIIGGFEMPDMGRVIFDGKDITNLPPNKRPINTVFQKYSLFSHMNVEENIAFGPKIAGKSDDYIRDKIKYALKLVNLEGYEKHDVTKLSGGQQQRIAIARAVVNEPKVLLLDEPLSALDLKLRRNMRRELVRINKETGITFIFVTHDQEEALSMSDRVVVMNQGYIQQVGTPEDVYNEPENAFVADFIGDSNIIDGVMVRDRLVRIFGREYPCVDEGFPEECPVDVQIRPEDIILDAPQEGAFNGVVTNAVFWGMSYDINVEADGFEWLIQSTTRRTVGERVSLHVAPENIQIMSKPQSEDEEVARNV